MLMGDINIAALEYGCIDLLTDNFTAIRLGKHSKTMAKKAKKAATKAAPKKAAKPAARKAPRKAAKIKAAKKK